MLVIRFVRTGKKHQAYFRIAVADSKKSPTAKFVEILGNYDPHAKKLAIEKDRLDFYLKNGAKPSNSVAKLFKAEKIALPKWVKITEKKKAAKKKTEAKENPSAHSTEAQGGEQSRTTAAQDTDKSAETPVENSETVESTKTEETKIEAAPEETPAETPAKEVKEEKVEEPAAEADASQAKAPAETSSEDSAEK